MDLKIVVLACILFLGYNRLIAQVAINNDGAAPDNSAILDLQSTDKGLLLPRIDFNNRPDPAVAGLLIFVTANGPAGDNALYLFDGTGWLKLASASYYIGQQIGGGKVFWLEPSGTHGLISAEADQGNTEWGCSGTLIGPDAQHSALGTGDTNTMAIVAGCTDNWIAAYMCDTLMLNGFTDWYLPAIDELYEMYVQQTSIGGFSPTFYWSSTESAFAEDPSLAAWIIIFDTGFTGWTDKSGTFNVRCIRKF